jgi:hypothetical protein
MRAPPGIGPLGFFVLMLGLGLRLDTAWQGIAWVLIAAGATGAGLALGDERATPRPDAFVSGVGRE